MTVIDLARLPDDSDTAAVAFSEPGRVFKQRMTGRGAPSPWFREDEKEPARA